MIIDPLPLAGAFEIRPTQHGDDRGFFSEVYNKNLFADAGIDMNFVQDNHSLSTAKGVLRGLHYQKPPFAQDKLVRVARGSVYDVIVDVRHGSPTYKQWFGIEISSKKWNQLFVPKGFLHAFLTLDDNTEFLYKVTDFYSPEYDAAIRFDDPEIGIEWPLSADQISLSERDRQAPLLCESDPGFRYGET